jgi:membrane protein
MPLFNYFKTVFQEFGKDKGSQMSAAFAYTGVFALIPFLIVIITIAGFVFGQKAIEGQLFSNISDIIGPSTAATIQHAIAHTYQSKNHGLALIVGIGGSLLAASALAGQLQKDFDTIFAVVPDPKGGISRMIYVKFKNVVVLLAGSLIVTASVVTSALISAAGARLAEHIGVPAGSLGQINLLSSFVFFIVGLYLIYRILPDVKVPKKIVLITALSVSIVFLIGKTILAWVIGHNGTASAYGAAASLITLLLWFYYTAYFLLLGAEGMKVYVNEHHIDYKSKKYTLKQKTVNIQAKNNISGQMTEKFARGFTKTFRKSK